MGKNIRYMFPAAVLLLTGLAAQGQATIQPQVPQAGLVQKSQLWNLAATYAATDNPLVVVGLVLKDRVSGEPVLTGSSAAFRLAYGAQVLTELSLGPVTYVYSAPSADGGSGLLAAGMYEACYTLETADQKTGLGDACVTVDVEAMSPPILSLPSDSALLETQYPQFMWLPPTPVTIFPFLKYDLLVSEVFPGQTAQEALQRNSPFYSVGGLTENVAVYPSTSPMPDTGRYYAWQVTARNGDTYGAKSEVWVFRLTTPSPSQASAQAVYYPRLTKKIYDAIHKAGSPLRFEFVNEGNERVAEARLFTTAGGRRQLTDTRQVKLSPGQNYITWDAALPARSAKEQSLVLSLLLPSGQEWGCVFTLGAK